LDEALKTIREMNFAKVDLAIHEAGPHLKPSEIGAQVGKLSQKLRASNLAISAFHLDFNGADLNAAREQLKPICRLARVLAVPLVTVPASASGTDLELETSRLREWCKIADAEGVMLTVETHRETMTAQPTVAVELCKHVRGLGLTLDPSHYTCLPGGPIDYDVVMPHVRHVRLRDSGVTPSEFQVRIGQGNIEFGKIITQLEQYHYDRTFTIDVRDIADSPFPVDSEVRKMKYLLESQV
jgi:sugar phosphate isomerase/epimerase